MSQINTIQTIVWVVTFRDSARSPQQELIRYTSEAAIKFARHIIENGGIAIITETTEEAAPTSFDEPLNPLNPRSPLIW